MFLKPGQLRWRSHISKHLVTTVLDGAIPIFPSIVCSGSLCRGLPSGLVLCGTVPWTRLGDWSDKQYFQSFSFLNWGRDKQARERFQDLSENCDHMPFTSLDPHFSIAEVRLTAEVPQIASQM